MPVDHKKRKGKRSQDGSRRKMQRGPKLPKALVKELGYAEGPYHEKGRDKKKAKHTGPLHGTSKEENISWPGRMTPTKPSQQVKLGSSIPDSIEGELQMQSTLAKKLRLKKGQCRTGPDDGLDDLLDGFEDLNGAIPLENPSMHQPPSQEVSLDSDDPGFIDTADGSIDAGSDSDSDRLVDSDDANEEQCLQAEPGGEDSPDSDNHQPLARKGVSIAQNVDTTMHPACTPSQSTQRQPNMSAPVSRHQFEGQGLKGPEEQLQRDKYVPPALRRQFESAKPINMQPKPSSEEAAAQRQIRRLFNRVATANMHGIALEITSLFESFPRLLLIETIVQALMQALEEGPRAVDQFAAVMACLITLVSALSNMQELVARVMLALAHGLQKSRATQNSVASSNTVRVVCCMYLCKGIGSRVIYTLLEHLKDSFSDADVHLILLVLQTVGYQLRVDDAVAMKAFIESVHAKSAELKASNRLTQRARLMLELIVDIKNNRKRSYTGGHVGLEATVPPSTLKQLRDSNVDAIELHHIEWQQLCRSDHRGAWWLPQASAVSGPAEVGARPRAAISSHPESSALLQLASKQRMNTDSRRAIFCVLMSADDYMDAVERIMRLPLKGTAERDIAHVLLHCCMQEEGWNPFYALVAAQIISHSKSHKNCMQFAVQDRMRRVSELNARQATNLASLLAQLLATRALPGTIFKVLDLRRPSKRSGLFLRYCLQRLLTNLGNDAEINLLFSQLHSPDLKSSLSNFISKSMGPWLAGLEASKERDSLLLKMKTAEDALKAHT